MKLFRCHHCHQVIFFDNIYCEQCGYPLGFLPDRLELAPLVPGPDKTFTLWGEPSGKTYRYCLNYTHVVCNWMVEADSPQTFCRACSLNRTIPNLSQPEFILRWRTIENAKHWLLYALLRMKLPLKSKVEEPVAGLSFDFKADEGPAAQRILTGHEDGHITINIAEADDIEREMARKQMAEVYRTVLGHFRHEIGHYYWDRLIDGTHQLEPFRKLFGDERTDYTAAVQRHYAAGPPADWYLHYISAYATTHPWEDWAETWAHYLHIMDTLETASAYHLHIAPPLARDLVPLQAAITEDPYEQQDFNRIFDQWLPLSSLMNSVNRSMGMNDVYPFIIRPNAIEKLSFIHQVCLPYRQANSQPQTKWTAGSLN